MKKQIKQRSSEGYDPGQDTAEKSLEIIIQESKTKVGAYQKILKSLDRKKEENSL